MEGEKLNYKISKTFVNGNIVYDEGNIKGETKGKLLTFNRE
jgi:hypothetical protein